MAIRWKSQPVAAQKGHLKLFGDCSLTFDGRPVPGVPASFYRIAAYLILARNGGIQPRHRLRALLWSGADDGKAAANMRQALARIRHLQDEHDFNLIDADFFTIRLTGLHVIQCDLVDFIDYREGLPSVKPVDLVSLYDGELLGGLPPGGDGFEEWLAPHRETFVVEVVDHLLAGLDPASDLTKENRCIYALRLLEIDPYHELALHVLMRQAADRRQVARLTHLYESMRGILGDDLGIEPSQETHELYLDLMQKLKAG